MLARMLDGFRVVIGSYLPILCCPSIDFFVRTTNSTITEGLLSNKINEIMRAIFLAKRRLIREHIFEKV